MIGCGVVGCGRFRHSKYVNTYFTVNNDTFPLPIYIIYIFVGYRDENYEELRLRRATQSYENAEYIRPDNPQGDVCGNTERPENNVYENLKY